MSRKNKEKPATPKQMETIVTALGQPLDEFVHTFTDDRKRKIFSDNLAKRLKQTEWLTSMSSGNGSYQPIYSEQVFQQINVNPVAASSVQIEKWLLAPQYFDQNLRHLSQYLSYAVGQYHRSIWYLNTIKAFNYMLLPSQTDVDIVKYDACLNVLQKMNVKYQMAKVDLQVMIDGVAPYWISETKDTISLLPLPADYCYITAPWTYGYLFAIDLVFFDQFISVPNQIPELYEAYKIFTDMRKAIMEGKKSKDDLPPYQYYQVPPDKGWIFSFNPVSSDKLPPLTSAMSSALDTLSYKELLKNKVALDLFKIIAMKIPLDKDHKQLAITYNMAEEITQIIQDLLPENIKCYSSPFESEPINTDQANRFDEIVNISNSTYYASAGQSQILFGSSQTKQSAAVKLSQEIDFLYSSKHMYAQYANFVNFQLRSRVKKSNYQVQFFGNSLKEIEELKQACENVRTCNSGILKMFACQGLEPFQVKSTLILEDKLGLRDLMSPLVSAFNSKNEDDSGRPEKTEKGDAGNITVDYDSNNQKFSLNNCLYCGESLGSNAIDGSFCNLECQELYIERYLEVR